MGFKHEKSGVEDLQYLYLHNDEFSGWVLSVTQLFPKTQGDAALRRLATVRTEVVQL